MKYWIVWRNKCSSEDEYGFVLGVYVDKKLALKACNKKNKINDYDEIVKEDINILDEDMLKSFNHYLEEDEWICSQISFKKEMTRLYFLSIVEDGGEQWIHVCVNKKSAIKFAIDFFDNEHDRDKECEDCGTNRKCRKKFISSLNENNEADMNSIDNDNCPSTNCTIYRMAI